MDARYWANAIASFVRNARQPGFLPNVARSGLSADIDLKAPSRDLLDLYPEVEGMSVGLGTISYRRSNLDPMGQFALVSIAQLRQPETIFEIGTFVGATTLLLARACPSARILTIDLDPALASMATVDAERDNARSGIGSCFTDAPEGARIEQILGDSRLFDFSPWYGTVDLVLVDGGHEYECVRADTATAFRLLRPGGVIVWDDYEATTWPGVVQAVDETGCQVFRIAKTDLAVHDERVSSDPTPRL
jgi:predicted O-methyltransferase YrrM